MHFKASKHCSLFNHNRHFAAHSLFIASINMEKPCLNSPAIGSPLMLTVIMVILVPGIIRWPRLHFTTPTNTARWSDELVTWNRKWERERSSKVNNGCSFFQATRASQRAFTGQTMGLKDVWPPGWGGQTQLPIHARLLTGKTDFACPTNLLCK